MRIFVRLAPVLLMLSGAVFLSAASGPSLDQAAPFDSRELRWTRLELKASKLFLTARTTIRLRSLPAAKAASLWISTPRGRAVAPAGPDVLEVVIESSGVGSPTTNSVWFNPGAADALQRLKVKHGKKGYRKAVRFSDEGTFMLRSAPAGAAEAERPHTEWSKVEEFFYPHPAGGGCPVVSEPSVLFYMLSAGRADFPRRICVFSGKLVVPVALEAVGPERLGVDYSEVRASASKRRSGEVEAMRFAIRPLAGGEDFKLMGLEGAVDVLIDQATRVPLEVRGRIGGLGRVKVRLTEVELGKL